MPFKQTRLPKYSFQACQRFVPYLKLTEKHSWKIPDRMVAALRAIIEEQGKEHRGFNTPTYSKGISYTNTRIVVKYTSPVNILKCQKYFHEEVTERHVEFLSRICKVTHTRIMWEYVMSRDNPIRSITVVGSENHVYLTGIILDYYFKQLDTYRKYHRANYSYAVSKGNVNRELFPTAASYASAKVGELIQLCSDTIEKELESEKVNLMPKFRSELLELWIPCAIKLDYKEYNYQTKPQLKHALSRKWHNKRFIP